MKKTQSRTTTTKPAASAKSVRKTVKRPAAITPEDRRKMIEETAYFLAESRGFAPGTELQNWIEAEAKVDAALGAASAS